MPILNVKVSAKKSAELTQSISGILLELTSRMTAIGRILPVSIPKCQRLLPAQFRTFCF